MGKKAHILFGPLAQGQTSMYQASRRRKRGCRSARVREFGAPGDPVWESDPGDRDWESPPGPPGGVAGTPSGGAVALFSNSTAGTTGLAPSGISQQEETDGSSLSDDTFLVDDPFIDEWCLTGFVI